jgi:hypothetical protein
VIVPQSPDDNQNAAVSAHLVLGRDGGDLARTHLLGLARFEGAVRRELIRRGKQKPCIRIVRLLFAALTDPAGVISHRAGALERVALLLEDSAATQRRLRDTEIEAGALMSLMWPKSAGVASWRGG